MSRRPSTSLKHALTSVLGEQESMFSMLKAKEASAPIAAWVESPAGAVIMDALDDIERAAMTRLIDTSPLRIFDVTRDRVEIYIVRYIRARLMNHVQNHEILQREIARLRGIEEEE